MDENLKVYEGQMPKADRSRVYSYQDVNNARLEGFIDGIKHSIAEAVRIELAGKTVGEVSAGMLLEKLYSAAANLLRNYEKCNQYPENITISERLLSPLRDAVLEIDKQEAIAKAEALIPARKSVFSMLKV